MIVPDWAGYLRFRDEFEGVMDPRLYTIEWLDAEILQGRKMVWVGREAAIVTKLKHYPTGARDIEGVIAAGDMHEIVEELIPEAEAYGRAIGCIGGLIASREGWEKVLKKHGYERHQVAIRKEF